MKRIVYILFFVYHQVVMANTVKTGDICHEADYYWGGVWVPYGDNQLICDYWTTNNLVSDSDEEIS
ncbi:hypothetical protein RYD26_01430 [Pasteurellaceae bacterium LIM206]|nr:hypothetical protein [Pasteurellaceae bacterium LIM206]